MGARANVKREKHIEAAKAAAAALGARTLNPDILFGRASKDDIEHYTGEMLAAAAAHAMAEIEAFDGSEPRVTVTTLPEVAPQGQPVSILSVTDRNQPFLYDSVMGEVTSTHRDIHLAVHPILVVAPGEAPKLFSPDEESDPAQRISHIEIHLSELSPGEAFKYSNTGYTLLGFIIERVSGRSYGEFLQENIFTPLGMKRTGYEDPLRIIKTERPAIGNCRATRLQMCRTRR